ncbi:potassium channel family protein [Arenicella sp. 4NH20-0111]|uniref:ion channel n=1 Tax=Arenicella sp. 4NH20-0111 TaxID=3127648 RepID=UPI003109759E
MLLQLFIGSIVVTLSIIIEVIFIFIAVQRMNKLGETKVFSSNLLAMMFYLIGITLWLLLAFSIVTWLWAFTLFGLGSFSSLEEALYFSMVAFTSLGFGDLILGENWRLLSGMIAANGLLLFGLNTAVLVETLRQVLLAMSSKTKPNA